MKLNYTIPILCLVSLAAANISGPYLFWGHEKVINLQPRSLIEATENDFSNLFRDVKAIVIFVRNNTKRLDGEEYPQFEKLVKDNAWTYLPQHSLAADPFNYNANIEVINLSGIPEESDSEIVSGYLDALSIYGTGEVLGILASREEEAHFISKREAKEREIEEGRSTTPSPTTSEETEESFIYIAGGKKAILYVNYAPELNLTSLNTSLVLKEHNKEITFDDQSPKGYGRLNIIFKVGEEKLFMRFNFTLYSGTWSMTAVEIEYNNYKNILPIVGQMYDAPSAPVGFSYRCSSRDLRFANGTDVLQISDYQVQPWLNGASEFGDVYDCVGFITTPIWTGIIVSFLLCGILSIGLLALMDIKTPSRFESSRSKPLTFTVLE